MTREEEVAIKELKKWRNSFNYDYGDYNYGDDTTKRALDFAIKALEQEDAIEKIRAGVESINLWALRYAPTYDEDIRPQIVSNVKEHVLEIIDKYREG